MCTGDAVCIWISVSTSTTITSSTTATATTPLPLEPSTDLSCTAYHFVISGDSCSAIETEYGISAAEVSLQFSISYCITSLTTHSSMHGILTLEQLALISTSASMSVSVRHTPARQQLQPLHEPPFHTPRPCNQVLSRIARHIISSYQEITVLWLRQSTTSKQIRLKAQNSSKHQD